MRKETYTSIEAVKINHTKYVSDDGIEFLNECDCLRYEETMKSRPTTGNYFTHNGNTIEQLNRYLDMVIDDKRAQQQRMKDEPDKELAHDVDQFLSGFLQAMYAVKHVINEE